MTTSHQFRAAGFLLAVVLLVLVSGCASVSVKKGTETAAVGKPQEIHVQPFATDGGTWNVDRQGPQLADFQADLRKTLAAALVTQITDNLVPASPASAPGADSVLERNSWLVTGKFVRVNQGSRALRAIVGFGAGGTKIETEVAVYDLRDGPNAKPFLTFTTTGGSGAEPGAIGGGPIGALPNAVGGSSKGLTEDARRTAREISAVLSQYMYEHGWILESQHTAPKYKQG